MKLLRNAKIGSFKWALYTTQKRSVKRQLGTNNGRNWVYSWLKAPNKVFKKCLWLVRGRDIISWKLG